MASLKAGAKAVGRTVHLKVHPWPRSIADTRQVLSTLRQFGEVEMFKHLKHEAETPAPDSFLAIFKDTANAQQAVESGKLNFTYDPRPSNGLKEAGYGPAIEKESKPRPATLTIRLSKFNHDAYIARQPYYTSYPPATNNSLYADLYNSMPLGFDAMPRLDYMQEEPRSGARKYWQRAVEDRKQMLGQKGYLSLYERAQAEGSGSQAISQDLAEGGDVTQLGDHRPKT